jgi:hypothetical protein
MKMKLSEDDELLNKSYKPIIEPIKELVKQSNTQLLKQEQQLEAFKMMKPEKEEQHAGNMKYDVQTPKKQPKFLDRSKEESFVYNPNDDDNEYIEEENIASEDSYLEPISNAALHEYWNQYHELPRQYLQWMREDKRDFDTNTGIRYNPVNEQLMIGNKQVELLKPDSPNFKIDGFVYNGTSGLYELLFKKDPTGYSVEDLQSYKRILNKSNALHRGYDPIQQPVGNRSTKYTQIIRSLMYNATPDLADKRRTSSFSSFTSGRGLFDSSLRVDNKSKIQFKYWDNLDELVDRLYLLHSALKAGNNSVNNEIVAIEEELREANIIQ